MWTLNYNQSIKLIFFFVVFPQKYLIVSGMIMAAYIGSLRLTNRGNKPLRWNIQESINNTNSILMWFKNIEHALFNKTVRVF